MDGTFSGKKEKLQHMFGDNRGSRGKMKQRPGSRDRKKYNNQKKEKEVMGQKSRSAGQWNVGSVEKSETTMPVTA